MFYELEGVGEYHRDLLSASLHASFIKKNNLYGLPWWKSVVLDTPPCYG